MNLVLGYSEFGPQRNIIGTALHFKTSFSDLYQTMCEALLPQATENGDTRSDLERLQLKLDAAKEIQETIKTLESSQDYLPLPDLETRYNGDC